MKFGQSMEERRWNEADGEGQEPRGRREEEKRHVVDEYGLEWLDDGNFRDTWGGGEILNPGEAEETRRFSDLLDGPDDTLEEARMYEEMEAWLAEHNEYDDMDEENGEDVG